MNTFSSEKEAALGLPQLVVRFLSDRNSWDVNETSNQNYEADAYEYYWSSRLLTMFFFQLDEIFYLSLW